MKKTRNTIYTLTVLFLLSACTVTEDIEFKSLSNLQLSGIQNGTVTVTADAEFNNPNDYSVMMKSINCDVYIDDNKVSNVHKELATKMPSKGVFTLPLDIDIPAKELKKNLGNIITGILTQKKTLIKLKGVLKVKVAGVTVPISFEHEEEKGLKL